MPSADCLDLSAKSTTCLNPHSGAIDAGELAHARLLREQEARREAEDAKDRADLAMQVIGSMYEDISWDMRTAKPSW